MLSSRSLIAQYVSLRDRRRDERRRRRGALAADVPLRAAGLLLLGRRLPGRDQRHPARRRTRPPLLADDRARSGPPSCSARRRCGSRCCATPTSTPATCPALRKGYYGASAMPVEVLRRAAAPAARRRSSGTSTARPRWPRSRRSCARTSSCRRPGRRAGRRSTSRPMLVDDAGDPVPPGEIGEIVHRSPHAALGYYDDEEKTADGVPRRLVPLRRPRESWTRTATSSVVDRKKDMIKTGGENVASREVEEAIYQLDGVAEVAVFGISHPHWIEAVTAVVVPKPDASLTGRRGARARPASTWPATSARSTWCSPTRCRRTPAARSSSASCGSSTGSSPFRTRSDRWGSAVQSRSAASTASRRLVGRRPMSFSRSSAGSEKSPDAISWWTKPASPSSSTGTGR